MRRVIELELDDTVLRDWCYLRGAEPLPAEDLRRRAEGALHSVGLVVVRWEAVGAGQERGEDEHGPRSAGVATGATPSPTDRLGHQERGAFRRPV